MVLFNDRWYCLVIGGIAFSVGQYCWLLGSFVCGWPVLFVVGQYCLVVGSIVLGSVY